MMDYLHDQWPFIAPFVILYLAGVVLSLKSRRRLGSVAMLALAGSVLLLLDAVVSPIVHALIQMRVSTMDWQALDRIRDTQMTVVVVSRAVTFVGEALLLSAIFLGGLRSTRDTRGESTRLPANPMKSAEIGRASRAGTAPPTLSRNLYRVPGAVGWVMLLGSVLWWGFLAASLPELGGGGGYVLSCLYAGGDHCAGLWYFADAGLPAYSPVFLWLGLVLLVVATTIKHAVRFSPTVGAVGQTQGPGSAFQTSDGHPHTVVGSSEGEWFYKDANGHDQGPATLGTLRQHLANGLLTNDTLMARRGDAAWVTLRQALSEGA